MVASFALYLLVRFDCNLSMALAYIGLLSSILFKKTFELKLNFKKTIEMRSNLLFLLEMTC